MGYETNVDVPSILKEQYHDELLSEDEFNQKAQDALSELESLRRFESEESMREELGREHIKTDNPFLQEQEDLEEKGLIPDNIY